MKGKVLRGGWIRAATAFGRADCAVGVEVLDLCVKILF